MNHLDASAMDALLAGTAGTEERAHVATCAECRGALERVESVVRRLKESSGETPGISSDVDRRMLDLATAALRRPVGRRVWIAAVAAVVMLGLVGWLARAPRRVDIVDAYQLALRRGKTPDVDSIAREAVSLGGRTR